MEPKLTIREYAALHAPISLSDVAALLPSFNLESPGDRAGLLTILAKVRVEYADAMIAQLNGDTD